MSVEIGELFYLMYMCRFHTAPAFFPITGIMVFSLFRKRKEERKNNNAQAADYSTLANTQGQEHPSIQPDSNTRTYGIGVGSSDRTVETPNPGVVNGVASTPATDSKVLADLQGLSIRSAGDAPESRAAPANASDGDIYFTPSGDCYHSYKACRGLRMSKAINSSPKKSAPGGLEPCHLCSPGKSYAPKVTNRNAPYFRTAKTENAQCRTTVI